MPDQLEEVLSQDTYKPTEYEDASWEVVGDRFDAESFTPLEIPMLPSTEAFVDPMFADYGGVVKSESAERWHLPEGVTFKPRKEAASKKESVGESPSLEGKVVMTEEELDVLKQQSFQEGQLAGLEQAVEQNSTKLNQAEEGIRQILVDIRTQLTERIAEIERDAGMLSIQIAEKLLENAVEINPEYVVSIVHEAIEASGSAAIQAIRISPGDLEFIRLVGADRSFRSAEDNWDFVPDPSIQAGCVIETSAGEVDFDLHRSFERIKNKLMGLKR